MNCSIKSRVPYFERYFHMGFWMIKIFMPDGTIYFEDCELGWRREATDFDDFQTKAYEEDEDALESFFDFIILYESGLC